MTEIGYALSREENSPQTLIDLARRAEEVGFNFALISDHCHPWIDKQGQSPFVWSVIGGISQGFFRFYACEILPHFEAGKRGAASGGETC